MTPVRIQPTPDETAAQPLGLARMARAWDRFFFSPADPLPLGLIRICTGCLILYVHLVYSLDLQSLVGQHGWVDQDVINHVRYNYPFYRLPSDVALTQQEPDKPFAHGMAMWSVFFHIHEPGWIVAIHILFLVIFLLFTIGFCTRVTSVLTWVGILSYIHRLPTFLFGMDTIMNILTIYLMIGPSGAALSVDRWLEKWWARRKGLPEPPPRKLVSANLALRLMQIHFCFIYLMSGLSKLQGGMWWRGTAIWYCMANYAFAPMEWPVYVEWLRWLCENEFIWQFVMFTGTYFTLAVEISFPYLIWKPSLRWFMIICAVMLHTGIGLIMGLATFSLFMLALLLSFVPVETLRAFVESVQSIFVRRTGQRQPMRGEAVHGEAVTASPPRW